MRVEQEIFGEIDGQEVSRFTIQAENGFVFRFINYGCVITDIYTPDQNGESKNIVLGFDRLEDYIQYSPYFGAVVGRVAGRIRAGEFEIGGKPYQLSQNFGSHHLHGGFNGLSHAVWDFTVIEEEDRAGVTFRYTSKKGEEGYPGEVNVEVTYLVNKQNQLLLQYRAETDEDTLLNLTNHTYFNLSGSLDKKVLNHILQLKSSFFLEMDEELLPTGQKLAVQDTAFDFLAGHKLMQGVNSTHIQNKFAGGGYDHPFILDRQFEEEIILKEPDSGRCMIMETNQPSVVVYTVNNYEDEGYSIRGTKPHSQMAICLETQGYPDAIHHHHFPSIVLKKGDQYRADTRITFKVMN